MGITRWLISGTSGGLVKPQSTKTQIAAQAKRQTRLLQQQNEILASQAAAQAPADDDAVPAGYYHADGDPANVERLWDGENWTDVTRRTSVTRASPPKRR
jgi:Protein of unknown function (DUF2510)